MASKYIRGTCKCCSCTDGVTIARWENVTKVRPVGDCDSPTKPNYDSAPYTRIDPSNTDVCLGATCGTCGGWLVGGDLNGFSAQKVEDTVNDIAGCTPAEKPPAEIKHASYDHNCYLKSGTVDMNNRRLGGRWVHARKYWQGRFGLMSLDGCAPDPNSAPDQIRYTGVSRSFSGSWTVGYFSAPYSASGSMSISCDTGVDPKTGIIQQNVGGSADGLNELGDEGDPIGVNEAIDLMMINKCGMTEWQAWVDAQAADVAAWLAASSTHHGYFTVLALGDTKFHVKKSKRALLGFGPPPYVMVDVGQDWEITVELSGPYTSADVYKDWCDAIAQWDMSDHKIQKWRTDEKLALAPLCCYDEIGNVNPDIGGVQFRFTDAPTNSMGVFERKMDDYSGTQNLDGSWPQRDWLDPNDYIWKYPNGSYSMPVGFTGGATLLTGLRTGAIISHNQAGSARHFWFGFEDYARTQDTNPLSVCYGLYHWNLSTDGGYSEAELPETTLRWRNKWNTQYDPECCAGGTVCAEQSTCYPQAWLRQRGGELVGGKYVEATLPWPSVNYGYPSDWMKYAVDQPSVCCVVSGNAGVGFLVRPTGLAAAPLATDGLAVNDYVGVENDGIYRITSITPAGVDGFGRAQWTINVGAKIDDPPTGWLCFDKPFATLLPADGATHIGRLRFPTASGICGRAAIVTSESAGTVTITPESTLPYLRKDPVTGDIRVDLYKSDMSGKIQATLTRVSDTQFTFVHAAIPDYVWMTGRDYDYTKCDDSSQHTGVYFEWTFDRRGVYATTPPTWYGDISGCLSCSAQQFSYTANRCPVVVGIVPFYSATIPVSGPIGAPGFPTIGSPVENFGSNQVLFGMPGTFLFDDIYGALWLGAVEMTMQDPFWQTPYQPDCSCSPDDCVFAWNEDNGCGTEDYTTTTGGGVITVNHNFFPHRKIVEAATTVPVGKSLPSGIYLPFDPAHNIFAPPYFPNGIPIGDAAGGYASIERPWGFALRVCENTCTDPNRFAGFYNQFTTCPTPP